MNGGTRSLSFRNPAVIVSLVVAAAAAAFVPFWFRREYNHDDFFFAYVASMRAMGLEPGRDYYLPNFTPIAEAFAPMFRAMPESFAPLIAGRVLMLFTAIAIAALSYRVARLIGGSVSWALVATAVLVWYPDFFRRASDVRSDNIAAALLVATAAILLGPSERRLALRSGIALGFALLCAYKVLFAFPIVAIAVVARSQRKFRDLVIFSAAAAAPQIAYQLIRISIDGLPVVAGVWRELLGSVATGPSLRADAALRFLMLSPVASLAIVAGIIGFASSADATTRRRGLAYAIGVFAFIALFVAANPFVFPYNVVIFLPLLAPLIAGVGQLLTLRAPRLEPALAIAIGVAAMLFALPATTDVIVRTSQSQTDLVRWIWRATDPAERVFDWQGMHFGRRGTLHWWNYTGLQPRYSSGWYRVENELRAARVALIVPNYRFRGLSASDREFLRTRYVQAAPCILTPGTYQPADAVDRGARFEIFVPGDYRVAAPSPSFQIDGKPIQPVMRLDIGTHEIRRNGGAAGDVALIFTTPRREKAGPPPCPADEILSGFN